MSFFFLLIGFISLSYLLVRAGTGAFSLEKAWKLTEVPGIKYYINLT
jgi:hypothetical protein